MPKLTGPETLGDLPVPATPNAKQIVSPPEEANRAAVAGTNVKRKPEDAEEESEIKSGKRFPKRVRTQASCSMQDRFSDADRSGSGEQDDAADECTPEYYDETQERDCSSDRDFWYSPS